ncbi:transcription initiation factor TFIID subunit 11 [Coemansia aciculifera]|uniref:Transcription initiation factor TFIID subunit 11 n=1 Tax=Coemansia aciculifera TaxID=417176 RepID=A0A9W8M2B4_9FUNG|nr:transcription initiation factor TFIID subunit 11 [Coemansia aciculifera]KAJ2872171.1 transcription initiation factor TFIID subunit 11 [Coemansia aciculifera]
MSSVPSRSDSGSGSPARGNGVAPPASQAAKKRPRLVSFTPADLLRQRKRRGGAAAGLSSARKLAGSIRSSPLTPSKARGIQLSGLVLPDGSASPSASSERKKKQSSSLNVGGDADSDDDLDTRERPAADGIAEDVEDDDDDDAQIGQPRGGAESGDEDTMNLIKQSKEEIKELWDQMSEDQRQRFDVYRRTALNKASIKKLVGHILNQQITSTLTFVVAGFSKVFVGEIVERAVQVQEERGDTGPLTPDHLREAYRLYKKETQTAASSSGFTKRLF